MEVSSFSSSSIVDITNADGKLARKKPKAYHLSATWMDFPSAVPSTLPTALPFKHPASATPSSSSSSSAPNRAESCPTGWPSLDFMLDGVGLPCHAVTEVSGPSGCGKTQLCLSAAVCSAWVGKRVLYVDTANGLTVHRIEQLISLRAAWNIDHRTEEGARELRESRRLCLSRIAVRTPYDPWELLDVLTQALTDTENQTRENGKDVLPYLRKPKAPKYDLILIDCLHNVLSPYFGINGSEAKSVISTGTVGTLGRMVTVDPLISSLGVTLKALAAQGAAVLTTNYTPPHTAGSAPSRSAPPPSAALSDVFDIMFGLSSHTVDSNVSTGARVGSKGLDTVIEAELVTRPPYYNMNPTRCKTLVSQLCAAYRDGERDPGP